MNSESYYLDQLSAERLKQCYEIAPPRVKQYLDAEMQYVLNHVRPSGSVLELRCGNGRVLNKLALKAKRVVGIDISQSSLLLAEERLSELSYCYLFQMNAIALGFQDKSFNVVISIQNGISAFKEPRDLMRESIRLPEHEGASSFQVILTSFVRVKGDS